MLYYNQGKGNESQTAERERGKEMKINHIDRYGTYTGDYMYFVNYESGDIDQHTEESLPKEARMFMGTKNSNYEFRKNKHGEYYNRWVKKA